PTPVFPMPTGRGNGRRGGGGFQVELQGYRWDKGRAGPFGDHLNQPERVHAPNRPELNDDETAFPVDGLDAQTVGHDSDPPVLRQVPHGRRRGTVAILNLRQCGLQLAVGPGGGDLPIHHQPLVHVGDVAVVKLQIDSQVDGRANVVLDLHALQLANGLLEQLHVHLEADSLDVAALLTTKEIAGAANLQV